VKTEGRLSKHTCWLELSNAADEADEKRSWVRITHAFHPLRDQAFRFVVRKRLWGEERVTFLSPAGEPRSVPVNWTDAARPDPYEVIGRGRSRLRVEDLLLLVELIDAGRSGQR
jgi:hypothetical protein